jgi:hypothetical protein
LEMGILWTVCLGWSGTSVLPITASQVARIIGVNHCGWLLCLLLLAPVSWWCLIQWCEISILSLCDYFRSCLGADYRPLSSLLIR